MKHALAVLVLVAAASGCDRTVVSVDPIKDVAIEVREHPAQGDVPAHFELVAPLAGHDPLTVSGALHVKAQDTCGEGEIGEFLDGTNHYSKPLPDPAVVRFTCVPAPIPGRVELAADQDLPPQPALAPGQERSESWGSAWGLGEREPFESMLGSRMRDIYVDACGERGVTIDRIATYVRPTDDGSHNRTDLFIDYTCAPAD